MYDIDEILPAVFAFVTGVHVGVFVTAKLYEGMKNCYNQEEKRYILFLQRERKKMQYVQYINKYPTDPLKHKDPMAHIKEEDYMDLIDPYEIEYESDEIVKEKSPLEKEAEIQEAFDGKYIYEDTPNCRVYMMHDKDHIFHYWTNVKNVKYLFLNVTCRKLVLACDHKGLYDEKENKYILKGNIEDLEKLKEKEDHEKSRKVREVSFRDFISLRNQKDGENTSKDTNTLPSTKEDINLREILL